MKEIQNGSISNKKIRDDETHGPSTDDETNHRPSTKK